jgi:hypothetical protein
MDLINRFNDYFDKIEEALNSPVNINWTEVEDDLIGLFEVDDNKFKIECLKQIGNNYTYSFSIFRDGKWSYQLANLDRGGFIVLATIMIGLEYLYNKRTPNSIMFSAVDNNDTRKRLYEKHCHTFCEKHNLKLSNRGDDEKSKVLFLMFNDIISQDEKEEIFQSVKKVIEEGK